MYDKYICLGEPKNILGALSTDRKNTYTTATDVAIYETAYNSLIYYDELEISTFAFMLNGDSQRFSLVQCYLKLNQREVGNQCIILSKELFRDNFSEESIVQAIKSTVGEDVTEIESENILKFAKAMMYYSTKEDLLFEQVVGKQIASNIDFDPQSHLYNKDDSIKTIDPNGTIGMNLPKASEIYRCYAPKLNKSDLILTNTLTQQLEETTAEFSEDLDEDSMSAYQLDEREIMPNVSRIFDFKCFATQYVDEVNVNLFGKAIDSIYYQKNLNTIGIALDQKLKDLIIGKEDISETIKANEQKFYGYCVRLIDDLNMMQYEVYSKPELITLLKVRSNYADLFFNHLINLMSIENYCYCGKLANILPELTDDGSNTSPDDDASSDGIAQTQILGYDQITKTEDGNFRVELSESSYLINKSNITLNGTILIDDYAKQSIDSYAYAELLIKMLRFGSTKSRYIELSGIPEEGLRYFDTSNFQRLSTVKIESPYSPIPFEDGSDYKITGNIYFFNEGLNISCPVGVVLSKRMRNLQNQEKLIDVFMDAISFYSLVFHKDKAGNPFAKFVGINPDTKEINEQLINSGIGDDVSCYEASQKLDDAINTNASLITIPSILEIISRMCKNVNKPTSNFNTIKALAGLELGTYTLDSFETLTEDDARKATPYVEKAILKSIVPKLQVQSQAIGNTKVSVVTYLIALADAEKNKDSNTNTKSERDSKFISEICNNCKVNSKIYNSKDEVVGYLFIKLGDGKKTHYICSKDDIGLDLPSVESWYRMTLDKLPKVLFSHLGVLDDEELLNKLSAGRMIPKSIKTLYDLKESF